MIAYRTDYVTELYNIQGKLTVLLFIIYSEVIHPCLLSLRL